MKLSMNLIELFILALLLASMIINIFMIKANGKLMRNFIKSFDDSAIRTDYEKLRKDYDNVSNQLNLINKNKEFEVIPGYRCLYKDRLKYAEQKDGFDILFEMEILEVSLAKYKVKALDFETDNDKANEPASRNGLLKFHEASWVDKSKCDLIINDKERRDHKLEEIFSNI